MITQEQLSAYLDGEATPSEARDIEAALAADAELRARLEGLRRSDLKLRAAMDSLLERPVPDHLQRAVHAAAAAREPRPLNDNTAAPSRRAGAARRAWWPAAIAAALVAGVMIGHWTPLGAGGGAEWASPAGGGAPQAGERLAAALGATPSGAHVLVASGRTMTPVITFISQDGSLCRQFELASGQSRQDGLACRAGRDAWRLVALTPAAQQATWPSAGGGYRTAAGPGDDAVSAMAGRLIRGEPMDAAAEAAALRSR